MSAVLAHQRGMILNFCTQCGNRLDPTDRFCIGCGQPLDVESPRATPERANVAKVSPSSTFTRLPPPPDPIANNQTNANIDPPTSKRTRRHTKRVIVSITMVVLVVAVVPIVLVANRKPAPSTTGVPGVPGLTSAQLISLEHFELHLAASVPWSKVGGLQNIVVGISKENDHWVTWQWNARNADPLTGYARLSVVGWRNINPKFTNDGAMERPMNMSINVYQGKWSYVTITEKRMVALGFSLKRYE